MQLTVCRNCAMHVLIHEKECPHCGTTRYNSKSFIGRGATFGMLLGLVTMVGCGEDEKQDSAEGETAEEPATEPSEPADAPLYGAESTD